MFVENALNLTPKWLFVAGLRYDHIDLERDINSTVSPNTFASSGAVTYDPLSWRVGTTYRPHSADCTVCQYTTAFVPVSTILIQSIESTRIRYDSGRPGEIGFKMRCCWAVGWG